MNAKLKKPVSLLLLLCVLLAACSGEKEPISTNRNNGNSGTVASTESTGQVDISSEVVSEEPEGEEVVSRIDYFDKEGERKYFEKYAYYDNGLLCSKTLYKIDREYGEYTYPQYTFLYLYDDNMEPAETLLGSYSVGITEHPWGEVSLGYEYDENGESVEVIIYPETESIEQEKFGVDPAKTEIVYGGEEVISTDQSMEKWATSYLREAFNDELAMDATQCKLIYVNDDDIPELWIDYIYGYAGAKAFTAGRGTTDSFYVSHGYISWKERENLILAGSGHMDVYSTYVYRIENGRFEVVTGGPWGAADNSNIQLDAEGRPIYEYHLDEKLVTEEEFLNEINSVFDENDASDPNTSVYSYIQCKKLLQQILLFNGEEAPDDQSETDRFINNLKDLYGVASSMEFETMTGGEWNDFPDDVFGFINAITIDLDLDEKEEIVVLRSEPDRGFVVEVYTATGHGYEQTVSEWIAAFSAKVIIILIYKSAFFTLSSHCLKLTFPDINYFSNIIAISRKTLLV